MSIQRIKFKVYIRTDKKNKKGEMPLTIRFSRINGVEPKFSLGLSVTEDMWDANRQCILGDDDLVLQKEITRIREELRTLQLNNIDITKDALNEIVTHRSLKASNPANKSFYLYMDEYVSKCVKNGTMRESTVQGYSTTLNSLKEFRKDILVNEISATLLNNFKEFLYRRGEKNNKGKVDGAVSNSLKKISATINYLEKLKIPVNNPFRTHDVRIPKDKVNDVFLEESELECMCKLLDKLEFRSHIKNVLLRYLFSCYTGLRIGDNIKLEWDNIILEGMDKNAPMDIEFLIEKSRKRLRIPLSKDAENIIYYAANELGENFLEKKFIFMKLTRNSINNHLKKLAKLAGIDKKITFHSSRRTFASLAKAKGINMQDVSDMMGHENIKMTMRYAKDSIANRERLRKLFNKK